MHRAFSHLNFLTLAILFFISSVCKVVILGYRLGRQIQDFLRACGPYNLCLVLLMGLVSAGCSETHSGHAQAVENLGGTLTAHLEFAYSGITDEDLADLDFPETIRSISLRQTGVTDAGITELARATRLEHVDLTNTKISDAAISILTTLPELRRAEVVALGVSFEGHKKLEKSLSERREKANPSMPPEPLPRIPIEQAGDAGVPEEFIGEFDSGDERPPQLSSYAEQVRSLNGELQIHLDLSDTPVTDEDLVDLPLTDSVRSISLRNTNISDAGLKELIRAHNLYALDLSGTRITDDAAQTLNKFPLLAKLDLRNTQMSQAMQKNMTRQAAMRAASIAWDRSLQPKPQKFRPSREKPSRMRTE